MLIVPLHRALTRSNFPWATLALILINVCVFVFFQTGDTHVKQRALAYYSEVQLGQWEFPAYRQWLMQQKQGAKRLKQLNSFMQYKARAYAILLIQSDSAFLDALHADLVITPQQTEYAQWHAARNEFERLWNSAFTERWELRFSEIDPGRMLSAMFLHGSIGHLLGNMVFLALLGLLVEGALGSGLFVVVYLLGGLGAQCLSLAWRWGDSGAALGASGAIAALMGAYCVLWGLRKVRFFWWFFVAFDYVKAPALMLLPFWFGWELLNLLWNKEAHIGFDAHAGGIVSGALLAAGVRLFAWERREFLDEDRVKDQLESDHITLAKALDHLGKLEIVAARALLEPILLRAPDNFPARIALYRCARYEPGMPQVHVVAREVLKHPICTVEALHEKKTIFDDYLKVCNGLPHLSSTELMELARCWLTIGAISDAVKVLITLMLRKPNTPGLAAACFKAVLDARSRGEQKQVQLLMEKIIKIYPNSTEAKKAQILLTEE